MVGLSASTLTFAALTGAYHKYLHSFQPGKESYILALGFQFVAILAGTVFNYELNHRFTWRDKSASKSKLPDSEDLAREALVPTEQNPDQASSTVHDFRRMPVAVKDN